MGMPAGARPAGDQSSPPPQLCTGAPFEQCARMVSERPLAVNVTTTCDGPELWTPRL